MSVFRPKNLNKRLAGTPDVSPGNGGQVGPEKTPYCGRSITGPNALGSRFFGGACGGVFKANESACGIVEDCKLPAADCGGFFICCGPSTAKWFVAPCCSEVNRTWYSRSDAVTQANACVGSCGWFVAESDCHFCLNACGQYWDCYQPCYWTNTERDGANAQYAQWNVTDAGKSFGIRVRAFRCSAT